MNTSSTKIAKGVAWAGLGQIGSIALNFTSRIVLARLLSPEIFGLFGMAAVMVALMETFSDFGLTAGLIQKEKATDEDFSTAFWVNLLLGIFLAGIFYLLAPILGSYYREPKVVPIIQVLSLVLIFNSLIITQKARLSRSINFKRMSVYNLTSVFISVFVSLAMAILGFGVWSLVAGFMIQSGVLVLLYFIVGGWRPKFIFRIQTLHEIIGFSGYVFLNQLLYNFLKNIDVLLLGRFYGPETVGLFRLGKQLIMRPVTRFAGTVSKVLFPVMSKVQNDSQRVVAYFSSALKQAVPLVTIPSMILIVYTQEVVQLLLDDRWLPAVPFLRVFAFLAILYPFNSLYRIILLAVGRADLQFRIGLIRQISSFILMYIAVRISPLAILPAIAITSVAMLLMNILLTRHILGYAILLQLSNIGRLFLPAGIALLLMSLGKLYLPLDGEPILIILTGHGAVIVLVMFIYILAARYLGVDIIKNIQGKLAGVLRKV